MGRLFISPVERDKWENRKRDWGEQGPAFNINHVITNTTRNIVLTCGGSEYFESLSEGGTELLSDSDTLVILDEDQTDGVGNVPCNAMEQQKLRTFVGDDTGNGGYDVFSETSLDVFEDGDIALYWP